MLKTMIMTSASNHENLIGAELFSHSIRKLNKDFQSLGQQTVKDYDSYGKGNEGSACLMTGYHFLLLRTRRKIKLSVAVSLS